MENALSLTLHDLISGSAFAMRDELRRPVRTLFGAGQNIIGPKGWGIYILEIKFVHV